jgi:hypothetical protein
MAFKKEGFMNIDNVIVCDIETRGYLKEIHSFEDFHVMSYAKKGDNGRWSLFSTNKAEEIQAIVGNRDNTLVFHNGITYDKPALIKMGFDFKASIIDTLGISYYLYSELDKHGLEAWGERVGIKKPEIEDWKNLSYEQYVDRCESDVKINTKLWVKMYKYFINLYENDTKKIKSTINYLNYKMEKLYDQSQNPLLIDKEKCENVEIPRLKSIVEEKKEKIKIILPKVKKYGVRTKPKVTHKKDGTLSETGKKWFTMLSLIGVSEDYDGEVKVLVKEEEPNPTSSSQIKDFLLSIGWKPLLFKDGANGKVPQIRDGDKNLCTSVKKLFDKYPELEALEGLSVAQHRLAILEGFLKNIDENNRITAWAHAFTRTLRLKHSVLVNLPKEEVVRGVIVAPKGYKLIGADLSSLEDTTKKISIYPLDQKYVESMMEKGYDPHLDLGMTASLLNIDEANFYKYYKNVGKDDSYTCPDKYLSLGEEDKKKLFSEIDEKRAVSKTANYALVYGAGIPKLCESTGLSPKEGKKLYDGYHRLNWSVSAYSQSRIVKTVKEPTYARMHKKAGGLREMDTFNWLWNDKTNLWLPLKSDKDIFSASNQNFGSKVFDTWCYFINKMGVKISAEFHDEVLIVAKEEDVERVKGVIFKAIDKVNEHFKHPIKFACDCKVGDNYYEVH